MENNLIEKSEQLYDKVFEEVREQKPALDKEKPKSAGFKTLPNGTYNGRLFIQINTVSSEKSKNYGLKKYEFQLTVTEGEHQGKMAYYHHVLMPSRLVAPLSGEDKI